MTYFEFKFVPNQGFLSIPDGQDLSSYGWSPAALLHLAAGWSGVAPVAGPGNHYPAIATLGTWQNGYSTSSRFTSIKDSDSAVSYHPEHEEPNLWFMLICLPKHHTPTGHASIIWLISRFKEFRKFYPYFLKIWKHRVNLSPIQPTKVELGNLRSNRHKSVDCAATTKHFLLKGIFKASMLKLCNCTVLILAPLHPY